jgi:hypothetical protein
MTVARRFIAGIRDPMGPRPGGTPEFGAWADENFTLNLSGTPDSSHDRSNFKCPSGTQILFMANPAISRRATMARPPLPRRLRLHIAKTSRPLD